MLIPSELRNPFPSNSLNRSASILLFFLLLLLHYVVLLRLLVFFVSPFLAIYLTLPASVFKDLITDSSLILSSSPILSPVRSQLILLSLFSHPLFLSLSLSASSSFHRRLGRIFHRRRNAVLPFPRKRNETEEERRCKRRRREESTIGEGSRRRSEERRRWITREVGRHADDKEADTMTGLFSARFEYIGSLWRGMNW